MQSIELPDCNSLYPLKLDYAAATEDEIERHDRHLCVELQILLKTASNGFFPFSFQSRERRRRMHHFYKECRSCALIQTIKHAVTALYIPGTRFSCTHQTGVSASLWDKPKPAGLGVCFQPGGGWRWINGKSP